MRRIGWVLVVVLTLVLAGCDWTQAGGDGAQTGSNGSETGLTVANVGTLTQKFAVDASSPTPSVLAQSGGLLYAAGSGTTPVLALDTGTGATTWSKSLDTSWANCGGTVYEHDLPTAPAVSNGTLYSYRDEHGNTSCGLGATYNLYFGTEALDASTGATTATDVSQSCNICGDNPEVTVTDSDPVVGPDGTVYRVTVSYGGLIGVNLANPPHAHEDLVGGPLDFTGADGSGNGPDLSTPAVTSTAAFLTESDGHLVSVKLADGSVNWSVTIPTSAVNVRPTPSTDGTSVYVTTGSQLEAFNAATGATRWSAALPDAGTGNAPATAGGRVFVRTATTLRAYDSASGALLWSAPLATGPDPLAVAGSPILPSATVPPVQLGSPSVANGVVYVGTQGGQLDAFDAAGVSGCTGSPVVCTPIFDATLSGPTDASRPIIFNGSVAISARSGSGSRIYRFAR